MFCKGPVKWVLSSLGRASIGELIFGKCSGGMSLPCPREPFTGGIMTAMSVTAFYAQAIPAMGPIPGAFINLDLLIGFSAVKVSLEKNAMMAPSFVHNGHQLFYFTRGNGRVQVASGDGENVFDQEVREGSMLVIPQFFPSVKIAGDQGLEWIKLVTSSSPRTTFLAGKNSVYRGSATLELISLSSSAAFAPKIKTLHLKFYLQVSLNVRNSLFGSSSCN
ncbi:hypothetical protein GOP47_0029390 [Adiantum capillus-veneris]|nr:hypothetical protein GOP47_0029390 [Adiantum capillus-veneris]